MHTPPSWRLPHPLLATSALVALSMLPVCPAVLHAACLPRCMSAPLCVSALLCVCCPGDRAPRGPSQYSQSPLPLPSCRIWHCRPAAPAGLPSDNCTLICQLPTYPHLAPPARVPLPATTAPPAGTSSGQQQQQQQQQVNDDLAQRQLPHPTSMEGGEERGSHQRDNGHEGEARGGHEGEARGGHEGEAHGGHEGEAHGGHEHNECIGGTLLPMPPAAGSGAGDAPAACAATKAPAAAEALAAAGAPTAAEAQAAQHLSLLPQSTAATPEPGPPAASTFARASSRRPGPSRSSSNTLKLRCVTGCSSRGSGGAAGASAALAVCSEDDRNSELYQYISMGSGNCEGGSGAASAADTTQPPPAAAMLPPWTGCTPPAAAVLPPCTGCTDTAVGGACPAEVGRFGETGGLSLGRTNAAECKVQPQQPPFQCQQQHPQRQRLSLEIAQGWQQRLTREGGCTQGAAALGGLVPSAANAAAASGNGVGREEAQAAAALGGQAPCAADAGAARCVPEQAVQQQPSMEGPQQQQQQQQQQSLQESCQGQQLLQEGCQQQQQQQQLLQQTFGVDDARAASGPQAALVQASTKEGAAGAAQANP